MIFNNEISEHHRVLDLFIRCNHCSKSIRKRNKLLKYGYVKGHRCHGKRNTSPAYISIGFCILWIRIHKVCKIYVLNHYSLGLSGGA